MSALLPLVLGLGLVGLPALASQLVPLECRLDAGAWIPCTMAVEQLGEHWWISAGNVRVDFRADGRGGVAMRRGQAPWRAVSASWTAEAALCWDGVCARGAIPLD